MLILAIESATPVAGVALLQDERLLFEQYVDFKKTHSETLLPIIDNALNICESRVEDLELVAISRGPGSFTGLRIGMAAAKGLVMASGARIIGVPTLQAMACNVTGERKLVCSLLDARKNEVYAGLYEIQHGLAQPAAEERAMEPIAAVQWLVSAMGVLEQPQVTCLGSGYRHYQEIFAQYMGDRIATVPPHLNEPRASAVGILAGHLYRSRGGDDYHLLEPDYIRKSEAEYKLEQKAD